MTIEEKAKRYDEAIEIAKEINNEHKAQPFNVMLKVFPELAESEDERIRKALVKYFSISDDNAYYEICGIPTKKVLVWLDKQKPSDEALEYLKRHHSPSEVSDFQAAMNIAVAKAYDAGKKQGEHAWSEEDEDIINKILCICDDFAKSFEISPASTKVIKEDVDKIDNWLKSIKPQTTWKPSDEQMDALETAVSSLQSTALESLYQKLNKLM